MTIDGRDDTATGRESTSGRHSADGSDAIDEQDARLRLEELGTARSTDAVAEKAELLRVLGRLDEALSMAEESHRLAFFTGDRELVTAARLRRARVFQDQGALDRALTEVKACRQSANTESWVELEASALYQQASVLADLERFEESRTAISELIELRAAQHAPPEQLAKLHEAMALVMRRMTTA